MHFPLLNSKIVWILLIISSTLFIFSVVLIVQILPNVLDNEIHKNVMLKKYTEQYDRFLDLPIPIYFKVNFFNVENPHDIVNGAKPIIKEVGPYVYKEYRNKTVKAIDDVNDTISYIQRESFTFDAEASGNYSDEDYIVMINTPLMGMIQSAEDLSLTNVMSKCLAEIFPHINKIFIKVKVKDILFDGVEFCPSKISICQLACSMAEKKKNIDKTNNGSLKFSFFNYKVRSDDGLYTIKRGIEDVQTLGNIVALNNLTHTNFWRKNSVCNEVKGRDSTLFPPKVNESSVFPIYSTDICRFIEIKFLKKVSYKGVDGYLFGTDNSTLRYHTSKVEDDCFCANQTKGINGDHTCFLNGALDLQPCSEAPAVLSFPHFLWADEEYIENVDGLNPNEDIHRTYLIVEPDTGTPLEGRVRIQLNAVLRPVAGVNRTSNLSRAVLPLLWIEEGASLNDEYIKKLNNTYFEKVKITNYTKWSLLGISTLVVVACSSYLVYKKCS